MKIYIFATIFLAAGFATSCDKFLDQPPTSQITVAQTLKDYKDLLYSVEMAMMVVPPELAVMGDDVYWTPYMYQHAAANEFARRAYMWKPEVYDAATIPQSWEYIYKSVYLFNKIVNEVMDVPGENPDALRAVQAQARFYRANCYFILAQTWAKPYQMASATDLGVPMLLENDVTSPAGPQATVHAIYEQILDDLSKAIPDLPDYPETGVRYMPCKVAAHGYKGKVLFFMGRYADALPELESALTLVRNETHPTIDYGLLDLNMLMSLADLIGPAGNGILMDAMSGDILMSVMSPVINDQEPPYYNEPIYYNVPTADAAMGTMGSNATFPSAHLLSMFETDDLRRSMFYVSGSSADPDNPDELVRMLPFSNIGLSLPELYLMLAECNVRAASGSLDDGLGYLHTLREARMYNMFGYMPITPLETNDKNEALGWILRERMCELAASGMRWLDMRRLWDDPVGGPMIQKTRTLGTETATLTADRLTLRIPEYVMRYNPEWTQHP